MADDPAQKYRDRFTVALSDPGEYRYFKKTIQEVFPGKPGLEIDAAIKACAEQIAPSESREKLAACIRSRLSE